jgi:hypothetical protein
MECVYAQTVVKCAEIHLLALLLLKTVFLQLLQVIISAQNAQEWAAAI